MTAAAVVVLNAIARDEYERDWHGWDEPFSFIDGDGMEAEAVAEFRAELEGETYTLPAREVAELVIGQLSELRQDVDEEAEAEEGRPLLGYLTDEEIDEEARQRLWAYWSEQLEGEAELMAVFDTRLHYLLEGWKALVADFAMIGQRIPELRPVLEEKLEQAYEEFVASLKALL